MQRLEPKRKYDCAKCGAGSANDQIVIGGKEYCPECAGSQGDRTIMRIGELRAMKLEAIRLRLGVSREVFDGMTFIEAAERLARFEDPSEPERLHDESDRPDFEGFAEALETEARWSAELHNGDKTGYAASDQRSLRELAEQVRLVGKKLGFL